MATDVRPPNAQLDDLVTLFGRNSELAGILKALGQGESAAIDGAWGSSCALVTAVIARRADAPLLVVLPRIGDVDDFAGDLASFVGENPVVFPAWESLPQEHRLSDLVFGSRLRILRQLESDTPPSVIVTSFPALMQPVPARAERESATRRLAVGDRLDLSEFLAWLIERGFERVTAIELPGEFSMRGGILDISPPDALHPLRIELFDDEIESIRRFDIETQRKIEDLAEVELTLVAPAIFGGMAAAAGEVGQTRTSAAENFLEALPQQSWIVLQGLQEIVDEGKNYRERLDDPRGLYSVNGVMKLCTRHPSVTVSALAADSMETMAHLRIESIERFRGAKNEWLNELDGIVAADESVLIACHNQGEQDRLAELFAESTLAVRNRVRLCQGYVARGFRLVDERTVVLSDHELFARADLRRTTANRKHESRAIDSFLDLNVGDYVVHLTNGIGRYLGMEILEKDEQAEEHLIIEFRDNVRVFVPVSLIHLVQKYIGGGQASPRLSKLGGVAWNRKKKLAAEAVRDLAADMLRLQAGRAVQPGIAYPPDSHWQQEFEASFPYTETPDQVQAIGDVKQDMQQSQPMDRLICGDVGYGKTEVAIRAAFKAIDSGKQVALLCPTTILAEQHFRTFSERMAEYPIAIEMLSRFRTKGEQKLILEGMADGSIDLVIGTHRLIQPDVRFKDLGLLVIDEEQRFGVAAKEMLKQLRLQIDVMTLSATPIPRTLHMSLLGIRDISNLTTPPQDRHSIETRLCRFDEELIRRAVVRELNRNGQVFFVHNKVYDIHTVADRLQQIVPEATIGIGHGQLHEHELEEVMVGFVSRRIDILVCTTIVESGLDIPNANTIFIHNADHFGLAELHQLRGRVGRYKHRAYCYLLLQEGKVITSIAAKRLKAIEEFSELGAGFKIAMRDLEIRGAGNLLGTEQSGHIAAVGYELYCQLLENAVRQLKNQPIREHQHVAIDLPVSAFLANSYIPPGRLKIEVYRRLSSVRTLDDLADIVAELRDRFGPIPAEAQSLLDLRRLQLWAARWQVDSIRLEDDFAVFGYRHSGLIRHLSQSSPYPLRVVDGKHAYLVLPNEPLSGVDLLDLLVSVFAAGAVVA